MEDMECDPDFDNAPKIEIPDFDPRTDFDYLTHNVQDSQVLVNNVLETSNTNNENQKNKTFKVISWNLDGLDERDLDIRIQSVVTVITENKPDFVFLQELINYCESVLRARLENLYDFYIDSQLGTYYCGILVKKINQIKLTSGLNVLKFTGSEMGRSLLSLTVNIWGTEIKLMTSHLESLQKYSEERKKQLLKSFSDMKIGALYSIFAGDLNVRDFELKQISCPPSGIFDVCELLFKNLEDMSTWEPIVNTNISRQMSMVPGKRFDRMYFYSSTENGLKPIEFDIIGKHLLSSYDSRLDIYTSDHWAICAVFSLY